MCDNSGRKNPTLHSGTNRTESETFYPTRSQQSLHSSSHESNHLEQNYVEASPTSQNSNIEPANSDDCNQATQSALKNEVAKPIDFSKKKTPMCLINELARHHKLQPIYRLVRESGPAHQKTFVVNVKLGDEEYSASGQSIKKAQHAAAHLVLQHTSYSLPEPKPKVKHPSGSQTDKTITPTVELNALAMKLNLPPVYSNLSPVPAYSPTCAAVRLPENCFDFHPNSSSLAVNRNDFRLNQVADGGRYLNADLKIPFIPTSPPQPAKQRVYYNRFPATPPLIHKVNLIVGSISVTGEGPSPQAARHSAARLALEELRKEGVLKDKASKEADVVSETDTNSDLKSPVSVAHELALKLNEKVEFTVLNESGPPHMRNFVVQCKIGEIVTQGVGNCKKLAKKKAAEAMLIEMKKLHPINGGSSEVHQNHSINHRKRSKASTTRKKPRNLVKEVSSNPNRASLQDPISQLVQLQQSRKEKEPIFTVVSERGIPRHPEFVVKVTVGTFEATGIGAKKKDAKRAAALKALEAFGIVNEDVPTSQCKDEKGTLAPTEMTTDLNFINGREMLPGLLLLGKKFATNRSNSTNVDSSTSQKTPKKFQSEMRLCYLAQILEYEIEFSNFPKGKTGEFVSLVTLNSNPPQVSHGLGSTLEEARDHAASNMLKLIAEGNLDSNKENHEKAD